MIRTAIALGLLVAALMAPAAAQLLTTFVGPGSAGGSGGPPPTPCTVGAVDLSLTTGCNIPQFMDGVIP